MKRVGEYLRTCWRGALLLLLILLLTCALLYGAAVEGSIIRYYVLLYLLLVLVWAAADFSAFVRRCLELEHQLQASSGGLESLPQPRDPIEERYRELAMEKQREKVRAVSEWDRRYSDLTDYFTLWAHQIKTPLAAMRLILQSREEPEEELNGELFKTEQYVEMVLSYLRADSESTDFVFRRCALDDLIKGAVRKYASLFIRRRISLAYEGTDVRILTDEKWLSFVLEQLLSNALKYTPAGGTVTVEAEEGSLTVRDTGIGIAAEDLPRIFEKGYTGYNGRNERKSTGIGLYLCRRILDRLGYGVSVASEPGQGTSVRIDFIHR